MARRPTPDIDLLLVVDPLPEQHPRPLSPFGRMGTTERYRIWTLYVL